MSSESKQSNKPQENQPAIDPGVMFLYVVIIGVLVWFFGFRNRSPDISMPPTAISNAVTAAPTDLFSLSGYVSSAGGYALNYPSDWQGTEDGDDLQFHLAEGAMVYVHVDDQIADFDSFRSNSELFSLIVKEMDTEIGGVPVHCVEFAEPESKIVTSIACFIPKNGREYIISLAELDGVTEPDRKIVQGEFMDMLLSFRFQE